MARRGPLRDTQNPAKPSKSRGLPGRGARARHRTHGAARTPGQSPRAAKLSKPMGVLRADEVDADVLDVLALGGLHVEAPLVRVVVVGRGAVGPAGRASARGLVPEWRVHPVELHLVAVVGDHGELLALALGPVDVVEAAGSAHGAAVEVLDQQRRLASAAGPGAAL